MTTFTPQQLHGYLARIKANNIQRAPQQSLLFRLHWAHLCSVPFENFSLRNAKAEAAHPATADLGSSYRKICEGGRGGYCFEQNGVFTAALRALGFDCYDGGARVVVPADQQTQTQTQASTETEQQQASDSEAESYVLTNYASHRIAFVNLDGVNYLVDVGFGGEVCPTPMPLPPQPHTYKHMSFGRDVVAKLQEEDWARDLPLQRLAQYRIRPGLLGSKAEVGAQDIDMQPHCAGYYLQKWSARGKDWKDLYFFDLRQVLPVDYVIANHYLVTSPDSVFRNMDLIGLFTRSGGRLTIYNDAFRTFDEAGELVKEEAVPDEDAFSQLLATHFGIVAGD